MSSVLPPVVGTILKLAVTASIGDVHLSDANVDFTCTFWAENGLKRMATFQKSDMIEESSDCYLAVLDTSVLGKGEYYLDIEVRVPDADVENGVRIERVRVDTGVRVR